MRTSRRDFLVGAGKYSAVAVTFPLLPREAEAQPAGLLAASWFGKVLWDFGLSVLTQTAVTLFSNWISSAWASPAPPIRNASERFSPKTVVDLSKTQPFAGQTIIQPTRALVVNRLPSLVMSPHDVPSPASYLNEREMVGLCDKRNPHIYPNGTYRLPMDIYERRGYSGRELDYFHREAAENGLVNPQLDYVRHFCVCGGRHLIGFGYQCGRNLEQVGFSVHPWA